MQGKWRSAKSLTSMLDKREVEVTPHDLPRQEALLQWCLLPRLRPSGSCFEIDLRLAAAARLASTSKALKARAIEPAEFELSTCSVPPCPSAFPEPGWRRSRHPLPPRRARAHQQPKDRSRVRWLSRGCRGLPSYRRQRTSPRSHRSSPRPRRRRARSSTRKSPRCRRCIRRKRRSCPRSSDLKSGRSCPVFEPALARLG